MAKRQVTVENAQPVVKTGKPKFCALLYPESKDIWIYPGDESQLSQVGKAMVRSATVKSGTEIFEFETWAAMDSTIAHAPAFAGRNEVRVVCVDALVLMKGPPGQLLPPEDVLTDAFRKVMSPKEIEALSVSYDQAHPDGVTELGDPEALRDYAKAVSPKRGAEPRETRTVHCTSVSEPPVETLARCYIRLGGSLTGLADLLKSLSER